MFKLFVNTQHTVTAIYGRAVYVVYTSSMRESFAIVETWLKGGDCAELATDEERRAADAIKALILSGRNVGSLPVLQMHADERLNMLRREGNAAGRASVSRHAVCYKETHAADIFTD